MIGIYIHIPFCQKICTYCDFCKVFYDEKLVDNYLDMLNKEIKSKYKKQIVKSIYIGGGTPSSLNDYQFEKLLKIVSQFNLGKNIEYTIEANPETLTLSKIKLLSKYNVNRVSLGTESFDDNVLHLLGRNHTRDNVFEVVNNLKKYGINNINIDLIYGVDNNIEIVKKDLEYFLKLDIPHLSYYSLIIEKHTMLFVNNRKYIDEDIEYNMYKFIDKILTENNYRHYEISNYAKPGYESIHNLIYWHNEDYLSFGLSAVSYIDNYRINNTKNMGKYLRGNYIENSNYEDIDIQMDNEIMLGLRLFDGIHVDTFKKKYKKNLEDIYNINNVIDKGYIIKEANMIRIKKEYMYLSNSIILEILYSRIK